jgi:hypothetical protein
MVAAGATMVGLRCCKAAVAAAATGDHRRCYNRRSLLLQSPNAVAARPPPLATGVAAIGHRRCYEAAVAGHRRCSERPPYLATLRRCYKRPSALLQSAISIATSGHACVFFWWRWLCFHGGGDAVNGVLPGVGDDAAMEGGGASWELFGARCFQGSLLRGPRRRIFFAAMAA